MLKLDLQAVCCNVETDREALLIIIIRPIWTDTQNKLRTKMWRCELDTAMACQFPQLNPMQMPPAAVYSPWPVHWHACMDVVSRALINNSGAGVSVTPATDRFLCGFVCLSVCTYVTTRAIYCLQQMSHSISSRLPSQLKVQYLGYLSKTLSADFSKHNLF